MSIFAAFKSFNEILYLILPNGYYRVSRHQQKYA